MPPGLGVWMSDIVFLVAGLVLLWRVDRQPIEIGSLRGWWNRVKEKFQFGGHRPARSSARGAFERTSGRRRIFSARFPLILDDMVLRDFTLYLVLIMMTFLMLTLVFTFFELLSDIVRNKVPLTMVADYLVNVTPSMIYMMMPLSVLLAVLITFGLMQKSSELTAIKASGISIYRMIVPVILISAVLAAGLFVFDQLYIPYANKRQETLRNTIKGKPAQTYLRPDRKWIFGEHDDMFYYEFYDPDQNRFANVSLFFFEPKTFQLKGRAFAARAHWSDTLGKWVFEQGWSRTFHGSAIEDYSQFDVRTFPDVTERPNYFKKEVKQSSEMNYRRAAALYSRPAAERVRRYPAQGATAEEIRLPVDYADHGDPCRALCHVAGTARRLDRSRRGDRRRRQLLRPLRPLRGDGKRQPIAGGAGGLGARHDLRSGRRIPAAESSDLRTCRRHSPEGGFSAVFSHPSLLEFHLIEFSREALEPHVEQSAPAVSLPKKNNPGANP